MLFYARRQGDECDTGRALCREAPAEETLIRVDSRNKRKTLIQNASLGAAG